MKGSDQTCLTTYASSTCSAPSTSNTTPTTSKSGAPSTTTSSSGGTPLTASHQKAGDTLLHKHNYIRLGDDEPDILISNSTISATNHFITLKAFNRLCRKDPSITSSAQLIYRLLIDECNRSRWLDSFTFPIDDMIAISHFARQTVIDARMRLKSKGLIYFEGKPTRYTLYSLLDYQPDRLSPPTPLNLKPKNKTKERKKQERKGDATHEPNPNNPNNCPINRADTINPQAAQAINARLKALGYPIKDR